MRYPCPPDKQSYHLKKRPRPDNHANCPLSLDAASIPLCSLIFVITVVICDFEIDLLDSLALPHQRGYLLRPNRYAPPPNLTQRNEHFQHSLHPLLLRPSGAVNLKPGISVASPTPLRSRHLQKTLLAGYSSQIGSDTAKPAFITGGDLTHLPHQETNRRATARSNLTGLAPVCTRNTKRTASLNTEIFPSLQLPLQTKIFLLLLSQLSLGTLSSELVCGITTLKFIDGSEEI